MCEGEDGIEGVKKFIFGIALQGQRRAQRVKWLQTLTDELWVRATVICMVCLPYKMHFFQGTRTPGQRKPRRHKCHFSRLFTVCLSRTVHSV